MKKVYEYMALYHEYEIKDGSKTYKDSKIILEKKQCLAKSDKEILFRVTREIPEQYADDSDNVEIIIRPF